MKSALLKLPTSGEIPKPDKVTICIGQIVDITDDWRAKIDYPGNSLGPVIARSAIRAANFEAILYSPVMLIFENDDPALPIIVGLVHENIFAPNTEEVFEIPNAKRHETIIDGKRLVLEADREIILRCGKSSITLHADGKVVVKGKNLISRASGSNKIKGSSVNIN